MGWANWNLGANFEMPTAWFDSMNGLLCIILAPTMAAVWNNLSKKGKDPSMMTKTALGIMLLGLGVAMMVVGAGIYNGTGKPVGVWIIILTAILMSVGEMLFSPLGNSFISEYAPKKYLGTLLGAWPFIIFFAGLAYGPLYNAMRVNFSRSFLIAAIIVFASGALMIFFKNKFEAMVNGTEEQRAELEALEN
jgi:dipeptide/tripeptide permease